MNTEIFYEAFEFLQNHIYPPHLRHKILEKEGVKPEKIMSMQQEWGEAVSQDYGWTDTIFLYSKQLDRLVFPRVFLKAIFDMAHLPDYSKKPPYNHNSLYVTTLVLEKHYFWEDMHADIEMLYGECHACQQNTRSERQLQDLACAPEIKYGHLQRDEIVVEECPGAVGGQDQWEEQPPPMRSPLPSERIKQHSRTVQPCKVKSPNVKSDMSTPKKKTRAIDTSTNSAGAGIDVVQAPQTTGDEQCSTVVLPIEGTVSLVGDTEYLPEEEGKDITSVDQIGEENRTVTDSQTAAAPITIAEPQTTAEPITIAEPQTTVEPIAIAEPQTTAEPITIAEPQTTAEPITIAEPQTTAAELSTITESQIAVESSTVTQPLGPTSDVQVEEIVVSNPNVEVPAAQISTPISSECMEDACVEQLTVQTGLDSAISGSTEAENSNEKEMTAKKLIFERFRRTTMLLHFQANQENSLPKEVFDPPGEEQRVAYEKHYIGPLPYESRAHRKPREKYESSWLEFGDLKQCPDTFSALLDRHKNVIGVASHKFGKQYPKMPEEQARKQFMLMQKTKDSILSKALSIPTVPLSWLSTYPDCKDFYCCILTDKRTRAKNQQFVLTIANRDLSMFHVVNGQYTDITYYSEELKNFLRTKSQTNRDVCLELHPSLTPIGERMKDEGFHVTYSSKGKHYLYAGHIVAAINYLSLVEAPKEQWLKFLNDQNNLYIEISRSKHTSVKANL